MCVSTLCNSKASRHALFSLPLINLESPIEAAPWWSEFGTLVRIGEAQCFGWIVGRRERGINGTWPSNKSVRRLLSANRLTRFASVPISGQVVKANNN